MISKVNCFRMVRLQKLEYERLVEIIIISFDGIKQQFTGGREGGYKIFFNFGFYTSRALYSLKISSKAIKPDIQEWSIFPFL